MANPYLETKEKTSKSKTIPSPYTTSDPLTSSYSLTDSLSDSLSSSSESSASLSRSSLSSSSSSSSSNPSRYANTIAPRNRYNTVDDDASCYQFTAPAPLDDISESSSDSWSLDEEQAELARVNAIRHPLHLSEPAERFQEYLKLQPSKLDELYVVWHQNAFGLYLEWQEAIFEPSVPDYGTPPGQTAPYSTGDTGLVYSGNAIPYSGGDLPYSDTPFGNTETYADDISVSDSDEGFNASDPVHVTTFEAMIKRGSGSALSMRRARVGLTDRELDNRGAKDNLKDGHAKRIKANHFFEEGRNLDHTDSDKNIWDTSGTMPAKHMNAHYHGENQWATYRGDTPEKVDKEWSQHSDKPEERAFNRARVHYMDKDEQQDHTLTFKDGKAFMPQAPDLDDYDDEWGDSSREDDEDDLGAMAPAHSIGASGTGTAFQQGADKHIFAMTNEGEFRTADAWGEHREEANDGWAPEGKQGHTLVTTNHSSLTAGDAVAAAGELRINDGTIEQLTDNTGHYMADNRMTHNALKTLEDNGVDDHNLTTRLFAGANQKPVISAAREFKEAYRQAEGAMDPQTFIGDDPRTQVAAGLRAKKDAMRLEIEQAHQAREERKLRAERKQAFEAKKAHNKKKDKRLFGRFSKKHRAKKLRRDFGDEFDAQ